MNVFDAMLYEMPKQVLDCVPVVLGFVKANPLTAVAFLALLLFGGPGDATRA